MSVVNINRRGVLASVGTLAAIVALGIRPEDVLSADNDTLKVRMNGAMESLDPGYFPGALSEMAVLWACMPRLAVTEKSGSQSWGWKPSEYVENIAEVDATHINFTLKPNLQWSGNLGELTAEDVKYSFERTAKSDYSSHWPTLDHVEVHDKYRGAIVLKSPFVGTFLLGIATFSGTILPKVAMMKLKDQKFTTELPAQLGPYSLTSWIQKEKAILSRNSNWTGSRPVFSEIVMLEIDDPKAAELAFEAHEVQLTDISLSAAARYKKSAPSGAKLIQVPGPFYAWMGMNTQNPKLKDIRIRKAIQRAVDVDSVLQGAYYGASPKSFGVIPPGIVGYRDHANYSFDPAQARRLLAESGVPNLTLSLVVQSSEPAHVAAAQIIQSNLSDVGIQVNIVPTDSGLFWDLGQESKGDRWKTLELWIMQYACAPDPSDAIAWFRKDQVGIWNWERWTDPEFEKLWAEGLVESDTAKRAAIYIRMQDIMENTGAYVWLTFSPLFNVTDGKVQPVFDPYGAMLPESFALS